ncbi:hypothetical protein BC936DRAFT_136982 [Jimgerdemannia flammicorona]|uniref:Peptide hydrolase n=1 Tax=Jimgerdemannia flammicorona TaxID=994334 RepID=A0A433CYD8_9FUNG|nr:hypothetical protein BC936DRAFT_136982 [Jimgerdemannia flammicorona]
MSQDEGQTQPLLSTQQTQQTYGALPPTESTRDPPGPPPRALRKTFEIYFLSAGFVFFLFVLVSSIRDTLPPALPATVTNTTGEFAGQHAWDAYLSRFATRPHPGNSKQILVVRTFIADVLKELKKEADTRDVQVELVLEDPVNFIGDSRWQAPGDLYFAQSTNILVKLVGQSNSTDALLVSAHYDSVSTSNGVTDNGVGVSVALEILRTLIYNPVKHNIIFNLNNLEEAGLQGAQAFMYHPWAKEVRAFINLEGAGAGGRATLFRASNCHLVKLYSKGSPTPHLNVVGNDVFKLGIIRSGTDYSIYEQGYNIPGLDIAFYSKRSHYHTTRDTLDYTTAGSVQHMGNTALNAARRIANSDLVGDPAQQGTGEASVYFDVVGIWAVAYSFDAYQWANVAVLVLVAGGAANIAVGRGVREQGGWDHLWERIVRSCVVSGEGLVIVLASVVAGLVAAVGFSFVLTKINPLVVYGHAWLAFFFTSISSFLGVVLVQWLAATVLHYLHEQPFLVRTTRHGLLAFWWLLLAVAAYLADHVNIGSLYWVIWFVVSSVAGAVVAETIGKEAHDAEEKRLWVVQFLVEVLVPFVLLFDLLPFQVHALRHTVADGSAEIVGGYFVNLCHFYGFCAVFSILAVLPFVPIIHRAGNYKYVTLFVTTLVLVVFALLCLLFPYDAIDNPNKVFFQQTYDIVANTSKVSLGTVTELDRILHSTLDSAEYANRSCDVVNRLNRCTWPSTKIPTYFYKDAPEQEFTVEVLPRTFDEAKAVHTVTARVTSLSAVYCRVDLDNPAADNRTITKAWVHGFDGLEVEVDRVDAIRGLVVVRREFGVPWEFSVQYVWGSAATLGVEEEASRLKARVTCYYEEWYEGKLPAFVAIKDQLPPWAVLYHRFIGLATVWTDVKL